MTQHLIIVSLQYQENILDGLGLWSKSS